MKTIDEMIAVMTAYKEGEIIECREYLKPDWEYCYNPIWDWGEFDYRIQPEEPKQNYRPYKSSKELRAAIKEHGVWLREKGGMFNAMKIMIIAYNDVGLYSIIDSKLISFETMFQHYEFIDGTPFGILDENRITLS